jgi:hypothetical protein
VAAYPTSTRPISTLNEYASQRRTAYSSSLFKTIKEEEEVLYSLFGLGNRKRKIIVVDQVIQKRKDRKIISFLILLFRWGSHV